jgi:Terpene synthase family 2, C-terminal metal binding
MKEKKHMRRSDFILLGDAKKHPQADEIEWLSLQGAKSSGLLREESRKKFEAFNTLTPYVYPEASVERAVICASWCNWLFFFDDIYDEQLDRCKDLHAVKHLIANYVSLLRDGEWDGKMEPLAHLMLSFRQNALLTMSKQWLARFSCSVEGYFYRGVLPAIENWVQSKIPSVESYLVQREFDGAVYTALDLIELAGGFELPESLLQSPVGDKIRRAAARTISYFNDIVSYPKEVIQNKNPNNLVHVLQIENRCTLQKALELAIDEVNHCTNGLNESLREFVAQDRNHHHSLSRYAKGLVDWQRGNVEFSLLEARYRAAESSFNELRNPNYVEVDIKLRGK